MTYETRTTKVTVLAKDEPLFDYSATEIEIIDEAGGEFLKITQSGENHEGMIKVDQYEWPTLKAAIEKMLKECRKPKP